MNKLRLFLQYLPYIFQSAWFNFHYLPFSQAIKLPILLYKPKLQKCRGWIKIESDNVSTGMIQLGKPLVSIYPNNGVKIVMGGGIIFKGKCAIGNNSVINISATGSVVFGQGFIATSSLKLVCYKKISFGEQVLIGWENLFCDTDFHAIKNIPSLEKQQAFTPINIGSHNWFAMKCNTLKGTKTPEHCIVGANSFLFKDYTSIGKFCLIAGQPAKLIKENVYRDANDDLINYGDSVI